MYKGNNVTELGIVSALISKAHLSSVTFQEWPVNECIKVDPKGIKIEKNKPGKL